jgi:choice-of-anchor B domain-containing protein
MMKKYILALFFFLGIFAGNTQPQSFNLIANINSYPAVGYNDIWGYTAGADGQEQEYALLGVRNGTSVLDLTDLQNIREVDLIPGPNSTWKDIKTYQSYAYVVTESTGGMQILDLSFLPDSVVLVGTFNGIPSSHNIYIDEIYGILYTEGSYTEPVRVFSLADPLNPIQLSYFGIECHDIFIRDSLAFIAEGTQGSIGIYNISNPNQPALIQRLNIPAGGYAHNVWTNSDNTVMVTTEETPYKTIKIWDISDLDNITFLSEYLAPSNLAHNVFIAGDYAYASHYESGLVITDIRNPIQPVEAASYDTYPQGNTPNYNGAWGVYPFTSNGLVYVSDMQTGLYVFSFDSVSVTSIDPGYDVPPEFTLQQNYPNPFNPSTTISFQIPAAANISLKIYNILGQEVRNLVNDVYSPGQWSVNWDGRDNFGNPVPSGMYIYQLESDAFTDMKKMILIR